MRFAREVIDLMAPFPGRPFRMQQLVRYAVAGKPLDGPAKKAARKAMARVLTHLEQSGHVKKVPAALRGGYAQYSWEPKRAADAS